MNSFIVPLNDLTMTLIVNYSNDSVFFLIKIQMHMHTINI